MEELVLCALPYHDTPAFVRIVQLLDLGNTKWAFLEGVKTSGAPPPRKVIVRQCIRDKGVLEAICNYASPTKKFQHGRPVVCFCTAVMVEALGSVPKLDTDIVQKVISFVFDSLNPEMGGSHDHKAGALMVVGLLATRATLEAKLIQNLIFFIARVGQQDAKQSSDLPWIRVTIMAIISLVQSQSAQPFSKKTMMMLNEISDLSGILAGLSREFNIQKFLSLYLETLVDSSMSDSSSLQKLITTIETVPLKDLIEKVVSKILAHCMKLSRSMDVPNLHEAGEEARKILGVIDKHYPSEFREAVRRFLKKSKMNLSGDESIFDALHLLFDEGVLMPKEVADSKFWFSLEHPKAEVRKAALTGIASSSILKDIAAHPQKLVNVRSAIVWCLGDDDLSVVEAALSVDGLAKVMDPPCLLGVYRDALFRCIELINKSTSPQACDVAVLCLQRMVVDIPLHQMDFSKDVATIIFPLLLVLPKTWRMNLKALEIVNQVQWPFYGCSLIECNPTKFEQMKSLEFSEVTSINMKTIAALAETFVRNPQEHIQWLVECCKHSELAKRLFLFVMLQASVVVNEGSGSILKFYQACSPFLRNEWHEMESREGVILAEELNMDKFDKSCIGLVDQLLSGNAEKLNIKINICIFWCILKACAGSVNRNNSEDSSELALVLDELFVFFTTSPSKKIFRKHQHFLVKNCIRDPLPFLSKYFSEEGFPVEVQVESLVSLSTISSMYSSSERSSMNENNCLQLLMGFPSLLIPLSSENKDVRTAAVNCIEGIYNLWQNFDVLRFKNGNDNIFSRCLSTPIFGNFLESIVSQKKLISSDINFLPSLLMSMLSPSGHCLLVSESINKRFDKPSKDAILVFILSSMLKFSSHGKLEVLTLFKGLGNTILLVDGVKSLLFELLERRNGYYLGLDISQQELSRTEIEILCSLLAVCVLPSTSADADIQCCLMKALKVDGSSSDDPAVIRPCVTVLQNLTCDFYDCLETDKQDELFSRLVMLFRNDNREIRDAARETLLRINISCSTIIRHFEMILANSHTGSSKRVKREKPSTHRRITPYEDLNNRGAATVFCLGSLLDILLLKKHIEKRDSLVQPLLQVLGKIHTKEWVLGLVKLGDPYTEASSDIPQSITYGLYHAKQTILLVLKEITDTLSLQHPLKVGIYSESNINLLVECAHSTEDVAIRNHVFLLLTSIASVSPAWLSEHIVDIFSAIGESAVKQIDSHSQHIMEDLISKLIPCWVSEIRSIGKLFQIFIKSLSDVAEHRRLTIMVYLLRSLGEKDSLGVLIFHLIHSLMIRSYKSYSNSERSMCDILSSSSIIHGEWEYIFAVQLSNQYSSKIWLPSLVKLLQELNGQSGQEEMFLVQHLAVQFILQKLQDTELLFELESGQDTNFLQITLGALMEQVVILLQFASGRSKQHNLSREVIRGLKKSSNSVLKTITMWMLPSVFFKCITQLLENADGNVKKKALELLCETIKEHGFVQKKQKEKTKRRPKFVAFQLDHLDESDTSSFNELCLKVVQLIDTVVDSHIRVKLAALSSLEVLSKVFTSDNLVFTTCLECVLKYIGSTDLAISSCCFRSMGSLVSVLGSKALPQLPHIMKAVLERAHEISQCPIGNSKYRHKTFDGDSSYRVPLLLSVLTVLEAVIANLGEFMSPYIGDILDLIILHQDYVLESDSKIKVGAATVRRLLTENIPVRLLLSPLLKIYSNALKCGEFSLCLVFEMLACMVSAMDRASIGSYHVKIYQQCLVALDIRRQTPNSVKDINMVEQSVICAIISLTMKLTETMFRPLFVLTLEWSETKFEEIESSKSRSLDRSISFYKLVNKLIEQHRSLFVPYFKYLIDSCTRYLSEGQVADSISSTPKKKKAKLVDGITSSKARIVLSTNQWHLRALILKSLYKCFVYDTKDQKFLDASNFQVLLKPIVSQFMVNPPAPKEMFSDIPTVEEVDESLVLCLGQMAVTAHTDVLWKPLNHDVLMQTRSEKVRPKILGLKVIRYLVEHLKEEYIVFLPETIPFLSELLEDVEIPVNTLAKEVLKDMETLSGENLHQYL